MNALNVEIKARCYNVDSIREILSARNARFVGLDHQVDTYFKVPDGRLKLRQGNIEEALIFYQRSDQPGPKQSDVKIFRLDKSTDLKDVLINALKVMTVVDKQREIYFIDNVKFHIDLVDHLGSFVEIEAIAEEEERSAEKLLQQCRSYLELFSIEDTDLVSESYSDLLMNLKLEI